MDIKPDKPGKPDRKAQMEAVVVTFESQLLRYAARIVRNEHYAQDVVQNVFIKLFSKWKDGLQPGPGIKAWLYRVTHNEAVDLIRRESRLQVLHNKEYREHREICADGQNRTDPVVERTELVIQNLHRLKPEEKQILLLRLEEGLSYREISEVTGRTEGNIGCILHHAIKKMSEYLSKTGIKQ